MTDLTAPVGAPLPPPPVPSTRTGSVAGAVTSGSIGYGLTIAIKLELNKHGYAIDDIEANALMPLAIVVLHPVGMIVNAIVDRLIRWLSK